MNRIRLGRSPQHKHNCRAMLAIGTANLNLQYDFGLVLFADTQRRKFLTQRLDRMFTKFQISPTVNKNPRHPAYLGKTSVLTLLPPGGRNVTTQKCSHKYACSSALQNFKWFMAR